jgi:hypothetical protein
MKIRSEYFIAIATLIIIAVACSKTASNVSDNWQMPEELKHCKVFSLQSEQGSHMYVLSCEKQQVINVKHSCGKNCTRRIAVIEG